MSMQEAFNKLRKEHPNSEVAQVIKDVEQAREPERIKQRQEEEESELKQQYYNLGLMWFNTEIDNSTRRSYGHDRIPIEQKKEQWTQALTFLKNRPSEQRLELLGEMASGMQLREDNSPTLDAKYGRIFLFSLFDNLSIEHFGIKFTRPSIFFMESISGMSDHPIEQKREFKEFMVREAGLKGKVGLPQLFPGISRWLDHK